MHPILTILPIMTAHTQSPHLSVTPRSLNPLVLLSFNCPSPASCTCSLPTVNCLVNNCYKSFVYNFRFFFFCTLLAYTGLANLQPDSIQFSTQFHACIILGLKKTQSCWLVSLWIPDHEPQEDYLHHTVCPELILPRRPFHIVYPHSQLAFYYTKKFEAIRKDLPGPVLTLPCLSPMLAPKLRCFSACYPRWNSLILCETNVSTSLFSTTPLLCSLK